MRYATSILKCNKLRIDTLKVKEFYMYGSQRIGYIQDEMYLGKKTGGKVIGGNIGLPSMPNIPIPNPFLLPGSSTLTPLYFGKKRYELNDWLGNVRVVINDRKTPVNTGTTTISYKPQVVSVSDYYSFGSEIRERTYEYSSEYRYSFNGKEKDNEVYGKGNFQDYGMRMYDTRLARFISPDPLIVQEKKYPWYSSYQFAGNKPVTYVDLDGKEEIKFDYPWSPQFVGGQTMDEKGKQTYFQSMQSTIAAGLMMFNPIEDAAIAFMAAKSFRFLKFIGKSLNYAIKYEDITIKAAEAVNQELRVRKIGKAQSTYDAYKKGTNVIEYTTTKEEEFVRVFNANKKSGWFMKKSDIEGLSPEQIKDKYSLSYVPDKIVDVKVPAGVKMRTGIVSEVEKLGTQGGGIQYQVQNSLDLEKIIFNNERYLKQK